jgi:predicted transposase/invertase (TIGR01784 family)
MTNELVSPLDDFAFAQIFGSEENLGTTKAFLKTVLDIPEDDYANDYELRNRKGRSFTDLLKLVILEIPKLPEKEDEAVWPSLQFFKCKKQEEFEMLARKHPELKEAVSCVKKMSFSEQWRSVMLDRQNQKMALWGQKEYIRLHPDEARTEAFAEGRAEGHSEEKLEIARKMKKMEMSVSQISELTGLSPEAVQEL